MTKKLADLIGKTYFAWTITGQELISKYGQKLYKMMCKCGSIKHQTFNRFKSSKKCVNCHKTAVDTIEEFLGKKFGYFTAIDTVRVEPNNELWMKCLCNCGEIRLIAPSDLRRGVRSSCNQCIIKFRNKNKE